jgi:E3 ubiquitin-protein ligase SIAH1
VRKKATTAQASAGVHKTNKGSGSSHPPPPPLPPSRMRPEGAAAAGDVTVEETDALDCGVCFLPLKPPIFQVHTRTLLAHSRIDP